MKIEDISKLSNGDSVEVLGMISDKRIGHKKDGNPYIIMIIQDDTGSVAFPIWDNYQKLMDSTKEGIIVRVKGYAGSFNGNMQIKNPVIQVVTEDINYSEFVPSYDIPHELVTYFINTVNKLEDKYKKIAVAATGVSGYNNDRWKAFLTCVAAEKFHGNKRGGLFLHTIGVMKTMESILSNYIDNPFYMDAKSVISKDRLMLKAIIHDVMKIKEYDYSGIIRRKPIKLDHIVMGAAYIIEINNEVGNILDDDELDDICYSILSHHGEYGKFEAKGVEDILLNIADTVDSQIVNAIENKI
ncbi:HD domain-containing protein [Clostridium fermenticellae]|uniref:HD domain-containing protein n=1 Tax=Clostridium fermenticellae TaxID=2068654 RepID=A0A386H152_9CLOT|nr:OB-fold nucleic acid binding domain-containing protein [Clostridium fermenticellae]AYD39390.1 HD domain-containing protein [Clostridium fermenticellae]